MHRDPLPRRWFGKLWWRPGTVCDLAGAPPHKLLRTQPRVRLLGLHLHTIAMRGGIRTTLISPESMLLMVGGVSGDLVLWRLDDGTPTCRLASATAAISSACISAHEMLVGTQEGDVLAYALDPALLWGKGVRDCAVWANKAQ